MKSIEKYFLGILVCGILWHLTFNVTPLSTFLCGILSGLRIVCGPEFLVSEQNLVICQQPVIVSCHDLTFMVPRYHGTTLVPRYHGMVPCYHAVLLRELHFWAMGFCLFIYSGAMTKKFRNLLSIFALLFAF